MSLSCRMNVCRRSNSTMMEMDMDESPLSFRMPRKEKKPTFQGGIPLLSLKKKTNCKSKDKVKTRKVMRDHVRTCKDKEWGPLTKGTQQKKLTSSPLEQGARRLVRYEDDTLKMKRLKKDLNRQFRHPQRGTTFVKNMEQGVGVLGVQDMTHPPLNPPMCYPARRGRARTT